MSVLSSRPIELARPSSRGIRADLVTGALALVLVGTATTIGFIFDVRLHGSAHFPGAPTTFGEWPVLGQWQPHLGPGTPLALLIAVAAIAWAPTLALRLPWCHALLAGYLLAVSWTVALALIDGWQHGIATRLTTRDEYLHAVPTITDIPTMLRTFTTRILDGQPNSWITHVAGHPPGATLTFVWLDRIGLGGGSWAAVLCVLVSASTAITVPVTISALGKPSLARSALPFVALLPGASWMGVSADALFAGVTAAGIALLALGARRAGIAAGVGAGILLGFGIFLSYGLILMAPIALLVVWPTRNWRALGWAAGAVVAVVAVFALAGFWWVDGYRLVVRRYDQSVAMFRPYGYWVWADLACLVLVIGPAAVAGLRRAVRGSGISMLLGAAALAVLVADLSGLSKAEVERIWLPFAVWLVAGAALLPARTRRGWLASGAVLALLVNHLLLTNW